MTLDDLEDEPVLLLDDGHCLRTQALALCKRAGAKETDLRATSLATLVQMVSAGAGVTLLPTSRSTSRTAAASSRSDRSPGRSTRASPSRSWRRTTPLAPALRSAKVMAKASAGR